MTTTLSTRRPDIVPFWTAKWREVNDVGPKLLINSVLIQYAICTYARSKAHMTAGDLFQSINRIETLQNPGCPIWGRRGKIEGMNSIEESSLAITVRG